MYRLKYKTSIDRWSFEPETIETTFSDNIQIADICDLLQQIPWYELYKGEELILHKRAKYEVCTKELSFFCTDIEEVNLLSKMFPSGHYKDYDNTFYWNNNQS